MALHLNTLHLLTSQEEQQLLGLIASEMRLSLSRVMDYYVQKLCSENERWRSMYNDSALLHLRPGSIWFMAFCRRNNVWKYVLEALLSSGGVQLSQTTLFCIGRLEESFLKDYFNDQDSSDKIVEENNIEPLNLNCVSADVASNSIPSVDASVSGGVNVGVSASVNSSVTSNATTDTSCAGDWKNTEFDALEMLSSGPQGVIVKPEVDSSTAPEVDVSEKTDKNPEFQVALKDVGLNLDDLIQNIKEDDPGGTAEKDIAPTSSSFTKQKMEMEFTTDEDNMKPTQGKSYSCPECGYQSNYRAMKAHLKESSGADGGVKKCEECFYETRYEACFRKHLTSHNTSKSPFKRKRLRRVYNCAKCEYVARTKKLLTKHMKKHKVKKKSKAFKCSYCDYGATRREQLRAHMDMHTEPLKCEHCSYTTFKKAFLKRHAVSHSEERPFSCNVCPYAGKTKTELRRHEMTHNETKQFQCTLCSYGTNKQCILNAHMANHTGEHKYKCEQCDYGTNFIARLNSHMKSHSDERPFKCTMPGCNYDTKHKKSLEMHTLVHTKEKRLFCTQLGCNYGTNYRKDLTAHILNHGTEKLYHCDRCEYGTNLKSNLNLHKKHCKNRPPEERQSLQLSQPSEPSQPTYSNPKPTSNFIYNRDRNTPEQPQAPVYSPPMMGDFSSPPYIPNMSMPGMAHMPMSMGPVWHPL